MTMVSFSLRDKFGQGVFWNLASFGVLGVCGILLNILIGRFYGPNALGIFNQVFALYILISQFAAFGLHYSMLKYVSEHSGDKLKCNAIITSALGLVVVFASIVVALSYAMSGKIGLLFDSTGMTTGWLCVLPGMWCFALNKVLLAVINGFGHMRTFAMAQAARFILMVTAVGVCLPAGVDGEMLPVIISVAEVLLFLFLILYVLRFYRPVLPRAWSGWGKRHLHFGAKSFISGSMISINSHIDIIMLGLFVSDALVGIYSMASMIIAGFGQLSVVLRSSLNPLLTRLIVKKQIEEVKQTAAEIMKVFYPVMFGIGAVSIICFPLFLSICVSDPKFEAGYLPFIILAAGLVLSAGYLPFNMILIQAGCPGWQTIYLTAIVCTNIILNAGLIPLLGINGAAYATGATFILAAVYLKVIVRRVLGFKF